MSQESLTISSAAALTLADDDALSIDQLTIDGIVDGTGTLDTECTVMVGSPEPSVNLCCRVPPVGDWITIDAFHGFETAFGEWTRVAAYALGVPAILKDLEPVKKGI